MVSVMAPDVCFQFIRIQKEGSLIDSVSGSIDLPSGIIDILTNTAFSRSKTLLNETEQLIFLFHVLFRFLFLFLFPSPLGEVWGGAPLAQCGELGLQLCKTKHILSVACCGQ